jgi:hypothetical protein
MVWWVGQWVAHPVGVGSCSDLPHRFVFQYIKLRILTRVFWSWQAQFEVSLWNRPVPDNAHGAYKKSGEPSFKLELETHEDLWGLYMLCRFCDHRDSPRWNQEPVKFMSPLPQFAHGTLRQIA